MADTIVVGGESTGGDRGQPMTYRIKQIHGT